MNHGLILTASLLFAAVAFSFEGPRLTVDPSAAPVMRTWVDVKTAMWPCVFAPADGDYTLVFCTNGESPYRVKANGLDLGEFRGETKVGVRLWRAENTICVSGPGAGAICGIELRTE